MPETEKVGQRIKHIRTTKGLTLDQLAERAAMSKSFLWGVEHGNSDISGDRLLRLANALGASLDFLMRGDSPPKDYHPSPIEIPRELSELAEELSLSYKQTLALLDIDRSIVARRSSKTNQSKTKEQWQELYSAVKQFLKEPK